MVLRILISVLALLLCTEMAAGQQSDPGKIRGKVLFSANPVNRSKIGSIEVLRSYSLHSDLFNENGSTSQSLPIRPVVYLKPVKPLRKQLMPAKPQDVVMDQKNERFIPHLLAIQSGSTVRFLNSDSIFHNVFSLSKPKSFDLGRYPQGRYKSVTFKKPGVVRVYCDIHTEMSAFILVLETPWFTTADEVGNFSLTEVPAGVYDLVVWLGRQKSQPRRVTVTSGETLRIEVRVP